IINEIASPFQVTLSQFILTIIKHSLIGEFHLAYIFCHHHTRTQPRPPTHVPIWKSQRCLAYRDQPRGRRDRGGLTDAAKTLEGPCKQISASQISRRFLRIAEWQNAGRHHLRVSLMGEYPCHHEGS